MKYLAVSLYHPSVLKGGAQYVAKDLHDIATDDPEVEAMLLAGIDSLHFQQYSKVGASIVGLPDGNNEFLLPGQGFNGFYHTFHDPRRIKAVEKFLLSFRPDVIHVHHSIWIGLDFLDIARKILPNVKILYTLHEYVPICASNGQLFRYHERAICQNTSVDQCVKCFPGRTSDEFALRRRMFQEAFKRVDHFISPSAYLRERFIKWGLDPKKVTTIANGHERQRPDGWVAKPSENVNRFGFFGQFVDAKGIDVLLEATTKLPRKTEVEVIIFGGNKQYASEGFKEKIDQIIARTTKNVKIIEAGAYSRDNVFNLMETIDWLVMPSIWPETFGLVVSEAWDAKRPVISSRAGGLGERVLDGVNGLTFAPGASTELARIIRECTGNIEMWNKLSAETKDEISLEQAWLSHKELIARV